MNRHYSLKSSLALTMTMSAFSAHIRGTEQTASHLAEGMTTLRELAAAMRAYRDSLPDGADSDAWQDFVASCLDLFGAGPWQGTGREVPGVFADCWQAVAAGESANYEAATGAKKKDGSQLPVRTRKRSEVALLVLVLIIAAAALAVLSQLLCPNGCGALIDFFHGLRP